MSFTSLIFVLFFAVAAAGWYLLPQRLRRVWLLAASYGFYACAGARFLLFLLAGTAVSYGAALACEHVWLGRRRLWTGLGAAYTLGVLFLCKYFNFFAQTVFPRFAGLEIGLPLGLSFFSFAVCGYLFDVQAGKLRAERNLLDYACFVAFFPVLLAGPIGKARDFLPQLRAPQRFDYARLRRGAARFVWGAFEKLVAADALGAIVDAAYGDLRAMSGGSLLLAAIAFSLQIYLDFSGYSDMAIGCADMLGFRVSENFRAPYLSRTVKEFWKKWHISLTDWFREYLYFPLGGSRKGRVRTWCNVLIVFAVSGLWHGAAWTFVLWCLPNGAYQVAGDMSGAWRKTLRARLHIPEDSRALALWQGLVTFLLVTAAWVFFRAESAGDALFVLGKILCIPRDGVGSIGILGARSALLLLLVLAVCLLRDLRVRAGRRAWAEEAASFVYWGGMLVLVLMIAVFGAYGEGFDAREFVYFRF